MFRISFSPSRRLALLLCLAHTAAAGVCLAADLATGLKIALVLLIVASCGWSLLGPALLRAAGAIVAVQFADGGALSFQTRRGEWHEGALRESSFVAPYLTVLNLKTKGNPFVRHIVILPDSIAADDFRRLRVWLRWHRAGGDLRKKN